MRTVLLVPDQEDYGPKEYLRDAARAQKEYWVDQKRTYWPEYHGEKVSTWEEIRPFVWGFICVAIFLGICAVIAFQPHPYQIIQPQHPRTFPTFNPNATYPTTGPPGTYPPIP